MFYTPKKNPFKIDPFKSLIFPRPIGWISSVDKNGNANLAPYSYFNAIADDPPQIMFASAAPELPSKFKDSLANILETKEFVVNFATSITRKQMNLSSLDASKDQDEFVMLLQGAAIISYIDSDEDTQLGKGDYLLIPAHTRHRVTWTDPNQPTIWLAVYC